MFYLKTWYTIQMEYRKCEVLNCDRRHLAKGLCATHYARKTRGQDLEAPFTPRRPGAVCDIEGCNRPHNSRGVCKSHYAALRRYGLTPEELQALYHRGCEICGGTSNLSIDHDHECCPVRADKLCGKCNRGVLCRSCNMAIGAFNHQPNLLSKASEYLTGRTRAIMD